MKEEDDQSFKAELSGISSADFPIGRHEWLINEPRCELIEAKRNGYAVHDCQWSTLTKRILAT